MEIAFELKDGVYRIPGKDMQVEIILASRPTNGAPPIITLRTRHPRIIHPEVNTHRVFSRNARSSRAVPIQRMLEEIKTNPFVPWHWGKNQKGMQAGAECNELVSMPTYCTNAEDPSSLDGIEIWSREMVPYSREGAWLAARDNAVVATEAFANAGYHKQIANRLLEPFMWIDTLITSTSWANFQWLRNHEDAEPHFHDLAALIEVAIREATYQELNAGQWHLPYIYDIDRTYAVEHLRGDSRCLVLPHEIDDLLKKISAARCARISYAPFDGDGTYEQELKRFDALIGGSRLHASPVEHQAKPDTQVVSRRQVKVFEPTTDGREIDHWQTVAHGLDWQHSNLAGNLGPGWIQFRKTLAGEYVADAA